MLVILFTVLTLLVLITGLVVLAVGGKFNKAYSNKLMTLRVVFQAIAIAMVGIVYYLS
jgi:hypothetical protein